MLLGERKTDKFDVRLSVQDHAKAFAQEPACGTHPGRAGLRVHSPAQELAARSGGGIGHGRPPEPSGEPRRRAFDLWHCPPGESRNLAGGIAGDGMLGRRKDERDQTVAEMQEVCVAECGSDREAQTRSVIADRFIAMEIVLQALARARSRNPVAIASSAQREAGRPRAYLHRRASGRTAE